MRTCHPQKPLYLIDYSELRRPKRCLNGLNTSDALDIIYSLRLFLLSVLDSRMILEAENIALIAVGHYAALKISVKFP